LHFTALTIKDEHVSVLQSLNMEASNLVKKKHVAVGIDHLVLGDVRKISSNTSMSSVRW